MRSKRGGRVHFFCFMAPTARRRCVCLNTKLQHKYQLASVMSSKLSLDQLRDEMRNLRDAVATQRKKLAQTPRTPISPILGHAVAVETVQSQ